MEYSFWTWRRLIFNFSHELFALLFLCLSFLPFLSFHILTESWEMIWGSSQGFCNFFRC